MINESKLRQGQRRNQISSPLGLIITGIVCLIITVSVSWFFYSRYNSYNSDKYVETIGTIYAFEEDYDSSTGNYIYFSVAEFYIEGDPNRYTVKDTDSIGFRDDMFDKNIKDLRANVQEPFMREECLELFDDYTKKEHTLY